MKKVINNRTYLMWTSVLLLVFTFSCNEDRVSEFQFGSISGKVVEQRTNTPIPNAKVFTNPVSATVFTDSTGSYTIENVEVGDYVVEAQADQYTTASQPAAVDAGVDTNVVFELEAIEEENRAPSAPVLNSPSDDQLISGVEVIFRWSATDPEEDPLTYRLELRNDQNSNVELFEDITADSLVYSSLILGAKYFWQVAVNDGVNEEDVQSELGAFEVAGPPVDNRFVFTRTINGNNVIFSADAEGNEFQLTPSDRNAYRPKLNLAGERIGFFLSVGADIEIYTMERDGSDWRRVTRSVKPDGFNRNELSFSWPADSDMIYYPQFDRLWRINSNGQGREQVYRTPDGSFISEVDVSENDDVIVVKTNDSRGYNVQIYTVDFDGNVLDTILSGVPGAASGVSLSVTNQLVVYSYDVSGFEGTTYRRLDSRLFQYNLVDDTTVDISGDKPAGTNDFDPTFSPNEAFVIFVNTDNDGISQKDVYQVEIDPEDDGQDDPRELLFSNAFMPNWE